MTFAVDGWPSVDIRDVSADVPGTRLVAAWALSGAGSDVEIVGTSVAYPTAADFARAVLPDAVLDESTALPKRVADGTEVSLVILWEVTDCAALSDEMFGGAVALRLGVLPGHDHEVIVDGALTPDRQTITDLGGC